MKGLTLKNTSKPGLCRASALAGLVKPSPALAADQSKRLWGRASSGAPASSQFSWALTTGDLPVGWPQFIRFPLPISMAIAPALVAAVSTTSFGTTQFRLRNDAKLRVKLSSTEVTSLREPEAYQALDRK